MRIGVQTTNRRFADAALCPGAFLTRRWIESLGSESRTPTPVLHHDNALNASRTFSVNRL